MHALYVLSVWLHILAAVTWIGGMFFLVLVVVPWLRKGDRARGAAFLRETGVRFRDVGWTCFAILLVTGTFNLWARGVRLHHLVDPAWLGSPFGSAVAWKFGLFLTVVGVSAWHDFWLGPLAAAAVERDPHGREAERLRKLASKLGRLNVLLALGLVAFAVIIVRGWPF
ncbi:MAG TPA: CopD family protein [Vulgatibacter sp.]|nr:CopD family protein [Vulgatibacter sp.]